MNEILEIPKAPVENGGSRSQQRAVRRGRANATQAGILAAAEWINWCKNNGWSEETLLPLEALWWKHHDENGKLKAPNDKTEAQPPGTDPRNQNQT